jgi:hypothetical protein
VLVSIVALANLIVKSAGSWTRSRKAMVIRPSWAHRSTELNEERKRIAVDR